MRIGPQREPFDQQSVLYEWCSDYGAGIFGMNSTHDLPAEMIEFILTQYVRFGVPMPEKAMAESIAECGAWAAYQYVDWVNPYALLVNGLSDVTWSDLSHTHTIEMRDPFSEDGHKLFEANPEQTEVFKPAPGQSQAFFDHAMANPGLDSLPCGFIGAEIKDSLFEFTNPDDILDSDTLAAVQALCIENGLLNETKYSAYFELAAWASFIWMAGPPGKAWRIANHDVFWLCETEGLAILWDHTFMSKTHYSIKERAPKSCCVCGLDSYCVELVLLEGTHRWICERHLNGEVPMYEAANCGSKVCRFVACFNHPSYGQEFAMDRILRGGGQLGRMAGNERVVIEAPAYKMIANK